MNGLVKRLCLALALITMASGLLAPTVCTASGNVVTLPQPGRPKSLNGLSITVDTQWVDGYGYRPIRVTVTSTKPTTTDQTITFRLHAGDWQPRPFVSVVQKIEMTAGSTTVSATIAVPRYRQWHMLWWDTLVDGVFDKALSEGHLSQISQNVMLRQTGGWQDESQPRVLFVGKSPFAVNSASSTSVTLPGPSLPQGSFSIAGSNEVTIEGNTITINNSYGNGIVNLDVATCTTAELPKRWIAYTALDAVAISADDVIALHVSQNEAFNAIRDWTATGGNLWVHGVGKEWEQLQQVVSVLGLAGAARGDEATGPRQRGWEPVVNLKQARGSRDAIAMGGMAGMGDVEGMEDLEIRLHDYFSNGKQGTYWRRLDVGIVLVTARSLEKASDIERYFLGKDVLGRLKWIDRHDLYPDRTDSSFAKLLIPGVGLAPVTEFRILITLFVLVIGPANYWLLKRRKRLHLLVLTVPLAAFAITVALFAYAFTADGLGTRIRARSLTLLDQTQGQAVCWARLSYYAGLAPSGGLEFSPRVAVYPILPEWADRRMMGGGLNLPTRVVQWEEMQSLTEGWLASRTPTQYLTLAVRPSKRRVRVKTSKQGVNIVNQLGTEIELLIVRGQDGTLYWNMNIGVDAKSWLEPIDEVAVTKRVRSLLSDHAPQLPAGYYGRGAFGRRSNRWRGRSPDDLAISKSRMEQVLASLVASSGGLGIDNRSYLAITATGPEVEMGVASYNEDASFHVMIGKW